jgi:hypothetical protein
MTIEKQLLDALDPILDEVVSVNKRLDEIVLQKGEDGLGIDSKTWTPGVYRDGAVVQHHIGQYFKALKDTAEEPGDSADWERVGNAGFRFAKAFSPEIVYKDGDLFIKDYGLFGVFNGESRLLAGRGAKGDKGEKGLPGGNGRDGKDGSEVIAFESKGLSAALVTRSSSGELVTHSIDFSQDFNDQVEGLRKEFSELSYDEVTGVIEKSLLLHEADDTAAPLRFYRGNWSIDNAYQSGDVISFSGKLYAAIAASQSEPPEGGSLTNPLAGGQFWTKLQIASGGSAGGSGGGESGPAGPAGPQGPQGIQGATGPAGATGATGPQGPQGPQGIAGLGITFQARIATEADLPATGVQGDMYIVDATGDAWIWSDSMGDFENAGPIVGPAGPQGPIGATGSAGPAGATGPQGPQGSPGPTAVSTDAGNTAVIGTDGKIFVPAGTGGGGGGAYLPLAGGTMTGPITMPAGTVMNYTNTYSMFTATNGVSFRFGAADLVAFANNGIYAYKPIYTPSSGVGISFGVGGGYLSKLGQGIGAYVAGALKFTLDSAAHTSTVPVVLPADPVAPLQAATKQYVDAAITGTGLKLFTRSQWNRTITADLGIANGTSLNLFNGTTALRETDKVVAGTDAYDPYAIAATKITVPWASVVLHHSIRVNFTIKPGGVETGTVSLRRAADNTIVGAPVMFNRNADNGSNQVIFNTYTSSATDTFVTGGFYITLNNDSGANLNLEANTQIGVYIVTSYASPRTF